MEKMINRLLENEAYEVKLIANPCNVSTGTIARYIRGSDVDPEWIKKAERANVGRHALTDIHNLNVNEEIKNHIVDRYTNKEITKSIVDIIKKLTKEIAFKSIPEEKVKEWMDDVINQQSQEDDALRGVVHKYSLEAKYTGYSHTFMHNLILKSLTWIGTVTGNNNYLRYLSIEQKRELKKSIRNIQLTLNPPIIWSKFPEEVQEQEKLEGGG